MPSSPEHQNSAPTPVAPVPKSRFKFYIWVGVIVLLLIATVAFAAWIERDNFSTMIPSSTVQSVDSSPCYVVQQDKVFLTLGNSAVSATSSYLVLGADANSFTSITPSPLSVFGIEGAQVSGSVCYGKDAQHVFFGRYAMTGADLNSFQIISTNPRFAKDTNYVYRDGMRLYVNIDASTFTMLDQMYGKDAKTVYYEDISNPNYEGFLPLTSANLATFVSLGNYYAKDSHAVYQYGQPIAGANPNNFIVPTSTASSDTSVARNSTEWTYTYADMPSDADIDPSTFQPLSAMYAKDAQHVYFVEQNINPMIVTPIAEADPKTFQVLGGDPFGGDEVGLLAGSYNGIMAKDSQHVYYEGKIVVGADPSTFVWINPIYGKDATHVYMVGPVHEDTTMLPISSDVANFWGDPDGYFAEDSNNIYFEGTPITGVDKATFVIQRTYPYFYGIDSKNVYYIGGDQSSIISGADPTSFVVIDDSNDGLKYEGMDKNNFYYDAKVVK